MLDLLILTTYFLLEVRGILVVQKYMLENVTHKKWLLVEATLFLTQLLLWLVSLYCSSSPNQHQRPPPYRFQDDDKVFGEFPTR